MQETQVWSLDQEDHLEKGMATHSSTVAWRIPWTEEPGGLQSVVLQQSDMTEWRTDTEVKHINMCAQIIFQMPTFQSVMSYGHNLLCAFIVLEFCTASKSLQPGCPHFVLTVTYTPMEFTPCWCTREKQERHTKISAFVEDLVSTLFVEPNNKQVNLNADRDKCFTEENTTVG